MGRRIAWIAAACVACRAYDGVSLDPTAKDGGDELDASTSDAGPPCDLAAPFGTPVLVPGINTPDNEGKPRISPDELTIHFGRNDGGTAPRTLLVSSRASVYDAFGSPRALPIASASGSVTSAAVSADFLVVVYSDTVDAGGGTTDVNLYLAARSNPAQDFGPPAPVSGVNTAAAESDPFLSNDGLTLYFTSTRTGSSRIFRATRTTGGFFGPPSEVMTGTAGADLAAPVVTADDQMLFLAEGTNPTARDVLVARRVAGGDFGPASVVTEVSSPDYDEPGSLSGDGCRLYMRSIRDGGVGGSDIYVASRPPRR